MSSQIKVAYKHSDAEKIANEAMENALSALALASGLSEIAGYGSQVCMPLAQAFREARYAFDTAIGNL